MRPSSDRSTSSAFSRLARFSSRGGCDAASAQSGASELPPCRSALTRRFTALCCTCAAVATATGCSMMMNIRPAADSYTFDLGTASAQDARAKAEAALKPLGYRFSAGGGSRGVQMESQWQSREPVDAQERASGSEIISRVKVTGHRREPSAEPALYHVLLT